MKQNPNFRFEFDNEKEEKRKKEDKERRKKKEEQRPKNKKIKQPRKQRAGGWSLFRRKFTYSDRYPFQTP